MKRLKALRPILLVIIMFIIGQANAQYIKEYSKLPDQNVRFAAVIPVDDSPASNLYISGNYGPYVFIGEFTQSGTNLWARKVNVSDTSITINQMIKDSNGHLVVVGTSINGELGRGFALKYNPFNKKVMWYQKATSNSFFWDIDEMGDGGDYVIGGQETGTGGGNQTDDITVVANRNTGNMTIISSLNKNVNESIEALLYDDASNSIYTTGRYELLSGASKFRICISNLDTSGAVNWTRSYIKSTATTGRFYSEDLMRDADTLIVVGGGDDAGTNSVRYLWLIKTDLDGNALLTNKYDITGATNDGLFSSIKKYENGYIVYGSLHNGSKFSDIFLFNLAIDGSVNWAKSYPFSTRTPTTGLYNASSMTIVGTSIFQVGEKRQPDGTLKGVLMMVPVETGEVATCGSELTCTVTSYGDNYDEFVRLSQVPAAVLFNSSLPLKSKHTFNTITTCQPNGLGMDTNNDLEVGDHLDFKLDNTNEEIILYPNPTSGIVTLQNPFANHDQSTISLMDISGKTIQQFVSTELTVNIDLSVYSAGIYLIAVTSNSTSERVTIKVVKQ